MRNLRLRSIFSVPIEDVKFDYRYGCIDSQNEIFYIFRGNNFSTIDKDGSFTNTVIEEIIATLAKTEVILLNNLAGDNQICIVYESGEILIFDIKAKTCQMVSAIPSRVLGGAWSPDQQQLILASTDELFSLSRDFEILRRVSMQPPHRGRDELLTVGWGSRKTQFQGAAGRRNRETVDVNKVPAPLADGDNMGVAISWRADGQFFAVSSVDKIETLEDGSSNAKMLCRQMRVWDRDLELMSRCEFLAGMEDRLCYCPTGNLIATTQLLDKHRFMRFFERNGQYRGKFPLQAEHFVRFIGWNIDATVLAVYFAAKSSHHLQLWMVSNYDWALKLQHNFDEPLDEVLWDEENAMRIHMLSCGEYRRIDFYSTYTFDEGLVVSFSGEKARLTDLRQASVPPPLCHKAITLDNGVPLDFAIGFGRLATLSTDGVTLTIYNIADVFDPTVEGEVCLRTANAVTTIYNLQWKSEDKLSAVCISPTQRNYFQIVELDLEGKITPICTPAGSIYWHKFNAVHNCYDVLYDDGTIGQLDSQLAQRLTKISAGTPTCSYVPELDCLLALTRNHQLCLGDGVNVYLGVSSFSIAGWFLMVTTFANVLFTINLKELKDVAERHKGGAINWLSEFFQDGRPIERGSFIIGHERDGTRVWLQMPRGNLETIHPRSLIVHRLKQHMDNRLFGDALAQMRRHRIDTNLLYDHNPEHFLNNIALLLQQVEDVEHLNLFITNLRSEDTRLSMFASYYRLSKNDLQPQKALPVDEICSKIRQHIQDRIAEGKNDELTVNTDLNLAVLSCFFMERKFSAALLYLALLSQKVSNRDRPNFFRKSLNYLTVLMNEQDLFRYALETYSLQLAVDVLTYTNNARFFEMNRKPEQDPKEMLPILNGFMAYQPIEYQHYHIDMYLEKYSLALRHIVSLAVDSDEHFAECVVLIGKQQLHALALSLFFGTPRWKAICEICGEFALNQRAYNEAGILFHLADNFTAALDAFVLAQNFQYCRLLCDLDAIDTDVYLKVVKKLCLQLAEQRKYAARLNVLRLANEVDAADLPSQELMEFCMDIFEWESAFRYSAICDKQNSNQNALTSLRQRLMDRVSMINRQVKEWSDALLRYSTRLVTLRATKARQLREWIDQDNDEGRPFDAMTQSETLSETSSVSSTSHISQLSKMSTATSRKRKQIERKKKTIKEGSHYEDAALLTASKEIYKAFDSLQDELPPLFHTLLAAELLDAGRNLQKVLVDFVNLISTKHPKIWPTYIEAHHLPGPLVEIYRGADGIVRSPSEDLMPPRLQIDPLPKTEINNQFFRERNGFPGAEDAVRRMAYVDVFPGGDQLNAV